MTFIFLNRVEILILRPDRNYGGRSHMASGNLRGQMFADHAGFMANCVPAPEEISPVLIMVNVTGELWLGR
jgi:hypothetical protein